MAEIGELGLNNEGKKSPAISPLSAKTQPLFLSFSEAGGYYFLFLGAKYGHFSFYWPYRPVKKINPQKIRQRILSPLLLLGDMAVFGVHGGSPLR